VIVFLSATGFCDGSVIRPEES